VAFAQTRIIGRRWLAGLVLLNNLLPCRFENLALAWINDGLDFEESIAEGESRCLLVFVVDPTSVLHPQGQPVEAVQGTGGRKDEK